MRRPNSVLLTLVLSLGLAAPNLANATGEGVGVGSGGDALRFLFEQARTAASTKVSAIGWCSFSSTTSPATQAWILNHQMELANDIQTSPHRWVVDAQPTCGFTQHSAGSPIYFSYPTCATTTGTDLNRSEFTVLHESAHHLGVADEHEADLVAMGVLAANTTYSCPTTTTDVFSPSICQGPKFSQTDAARAIAPGAQSGILGRYQVFARTRDCNPLNGCGAWRVDSVVSNPPYFIHEPKPAIASPVMTVLVASRAPYFSIDLTQDFEYSDGRLSIAKGMLTSLKFLETNPGRFAVIGSREILAIWGNAGATFSGELKQSCGWFRGHEESVRRPDGSYLESEIVYYGTH